MLRFWERRRAHNRHGSPSPPAPRFRRTSMKLSALIYSYCKLRVLSGYYCYQKSKRHSAWCLVSESASGQRLTSAPRNDYVSLEPVSGRLSGVRYAVVVQTTGPQIRSRLVRTEGNPFQNAETPQLLMFLAGDARRCGANVHRVCARGQHPGRAVLLVSLSPVSWTRSGTRSSTRWAGRFTRQRTSGIHSR